MTIAEVETLTVDNSSSIHNATPPEQKDDIIFTAESHFSIFDNPMPQKSPSFAKIRTGMSPLREP